MTIQSIHHVMVAIPRAGESEARRFYGEHLGLTEIEKPASLQGRGGLWFRTGSLELHLGIDPEFHPARKAHVAFLAEDLPALRRRLLVLGLQVIDDDLLPGLDRFYLDDPFGNRLEFLQPVAS